MAQTNVVVTYAPARHPAGRSAPRERVPGQRRWSATLAGALLAGGAVFALGQFVTPDGNMRETGFPMRPSVPVTDAGPVRPTLPAPAARVEPRPAAEPKPLPYLAVVRDIARHPANPPAVRRMSAPAVRAEPRLPPSRPAPEPETPRERSPALVADLAAPTLPPPASGLRRDLVGFLQAQGHELAVPDAAGTLVAPDGVLVAVPAVELAEAAVLPPVEPGPVEPPSTPPDTAAAAALVDTGGPSPPTPLAGAPAQQLADIQPPPGAAPVASAEPVTLDQPSASFAVATPPPLANASASSAPPQVQSYPLAVVNGEALGAITLRDGGASEPMIHLGALVGLLRLRMPEAEFTRLSGAAAADRFVSLDELRAAGIIVQFDKRENRLLIDAR